MIVCKREHTKDDRAISLRLRNGSTYITKLEAVYDLERQQYLFLAYPRSSLAGLVKLDHLYPVGLYVYGFYEMSQNSFDG